MSQTTAVQNEQNLEKPADAIQSRGNQQPSPRTIPPAARRALAEAEERRRKAAAEAIPSQREIGGRGGKDPARYGDWEIKGRAIDF